MRRGWQVPLATGEDEVTRVVWLLETTALETDEGTTEDDTARLDDTALVEEAALLEAAAEEAVPPQPNWMLPSVHVVVVEENPDQTKAVTALPLAPENWVKGIVMVCVPPVKPEMVV